MSVLTWPNPKVSSFRWKKSPRAAVFSSIFGSQSAEGGVPLWEVDLAGVPQYWAEAQQLEVLLESFDGYTNQLELWYLARPVPLGTMRGTMTLSGAEAQGSTSLDIVTSYGANSLTNPNNLAVSPWAQSIGGFWTSAASTTILGPDGVNANVTKFTAGATTTSSLFTRQTALSMPAGARNASLYVYVPSGQSITNWTAGADWNDIETNGGTASTVFDAWVRISVGATLAAPRTQLDYNMLFNGLAPVAGSGKFFYAAFAKEEPGTIATDYGFGKTLLTGDLLGLGSGLTQQVVRISADATSTGQGNITVAIGTPLRNAFTTGAAVTWNKPKALFRQKTPNEGIEYQAVIGQPWSLSLVEDWRP